MRALLALTQALLSLKHCRGALDTHSALLDTRAYALESRPTFSTAGILNKARVKALLAPALYDPCVQNVPEGI